ncbi:MAG: cysteine--tRNA ligase [Patescibacteria group bacterium]
MKIFNTLTRSIEEFTPINPPNVGLYTCGPTVYNYAHIGNLRTYVFEDILKRVLIHNGYEVRHIMNITDVGHLTDDADEGEDKMEAGAVREGKTAGEIADFYTRAFQDNLADLNILPPTFYCKATDNISEQIKFVQALHDRGFTYETTDGIYFDTTKLPDYGKLANLDKQDLDAGHRVEVGEKHNLHDFALWKFSPAGQRRQMEWAAFGKMGFPGWHIECSAMSMKYLGEQFDIHCGGVDHIPVHHTNEIAQSEALTGKKPWVKYWLHGEFLLSGADKMAKSADNFLTLQVLKDAGINPIAYRYYLLQSHYRKQIGFSWQALEAAKKGLDNLREQIQKIPDVIKTGTETKEKFHNAINNDLNTPEALAVIWTAIKNDKLSKNDVAEFDKILGLDLIKTAMPTILTEEVSGLLELRLNARKKQDWTESDRLRDLIDSLGYTVKDLPDGEQRVDRNVKLA